MTRSILIFVITLLIGGLQSVSAQVSFAKDKLYNIFPASQPEKVIAYQKGDAKPILVAPRAKDKFQQWSITDLSSSFRFMNPFDNQALHPRTDNSLGVTENNGSDESQLWTVKKNGEVYQIFPTNSPELILACNREGKLILLPRKASNCRKHSSKSKPATCRYPQVCSTIWQTVPKYTGKMKPALLKIKKTDMPLICLTQMNKLWWGGPRLL